MKKLSLKGLAGFMTKSPTSQRTLLKNFKYPAENEATVKILYYRDARDRIVAFHSADNDIELLSDAINDFEKLASLSMGTRRTRLKYNAQALKVYLRHFGKKKYTVLKEAALGLIYSDVTISVYPDLHVKENGVEKIIKLDFNKTEPDKKFINIISQGLYQAASQEGLNLKPSSVLYFDVPRGQIHKGARMGSRMASDIEAACHNISAIWERI